jgi:fumarylacetoacetase
MTRMRDETHDPSAESWVASANAADTDFPIQNLPFGCVAVRGTAQAPQVGVAIGDRILPLAACGEHWESVHAILAAPEARRQQLRRSLHRLLRADAPAATRARLTAAMVHMADAELLLPLAIGDMTDFFSSIHHATNAAALMRPGAPLFSNYRHMPLAYHSRSSSIVVSGTGVRRPRGQQRRREAAPVYAPTRRLDYEAELGFLIGAASVPGEPVSIDRAWNHIGGLCLVNDWSARDIQAWESDPLGPFLGKSFATTISPWVVTAEALAPFRVAAAPRGVDDPPLLDYLSSIPDREAGALSVDVEVMLDTSRMRDAGLAPVRISRSNSAGLYWTPAQLLAHQTSNGCNVRTGDLLGSGTLSGAAKDSWCCLLELTRGGREPLTLPNGESRAFLEDGDDVILRGRATAPGARSIGFGECRGRILAAEATE